MADLVTIKKIKTAAGEHEIDAKYWDGHSFSEITDLVHGVVDTYVIPANSNGSTDYKAIVEASTAQVTTTISKLGGLTGTPVSGWDKFKVGDIVLMGATSDGKVNFDRWISEVSGNNIKLDVLETQVATHHHTINISTSQDKAITGISNETPTSVNMAKVGAAVNVITGSTSVSEGKTGDFVSSVDYDDNNLNDNFEISISNTTSGKTGVSHTHTVNSHNHTVTLTSDNFNTVSVYTILSSKTYDTHTHGTNVNVAGAATASSFQYVTGDSSDATFVKSITSSSKTTSNTGDLETSTQVSGTLKGSSVMTASSGGHTHNATVKTDTNVITSVDLASKVVTSVSFNAGNVQNKVVTDVTTSTYNTVATSWKTADTSSFVSSWSCSVDGNGVLSFLVSSANAVTDATKVTASSKIVGVSSVTSKSQSAPSLSAPSVSQSFGNDSVTLTVSVEESGSHQHGFTHTHTISGHDHTYVGTDLADSGKAITSLSYGTWNTHTHANNVNVASTPSATTFTAISGGDKTSVLESVKSDNNNITSTSSNPGTSAVYHQVSGSVTFPGLKVGYKDFSTTSITPAADSNEKPIKSITFTSSNFITSVTSGTINTTKNEGGNPS